MKSSIDGRSRLLEIIIPPFTFTLQSLDFIRLLFSVLAMTIRVIEFRVCLIPWGLYVHNWSFLVPFTNFTHVFKRKSSEDLRRISL